MRRLASFAESATKVGRLTRNFDEFRWETRLPSDISLSIAKEGSWFAIEL